MKEQTEQRRGPGRPRAVQRRGELVRAAGPLFQKFGYANVSLKEVAGELGLGASALYRHFGSKEELLQASIQSALDAAEVAFHDEAPEISRAIATLAEVGVDRPDLWILLRRESLNLPVALRRELLARFSGFVDALAALFAGSGSTAEADRVLARSALACLAAPSQYPHRELGAPDVLAQIALEIGDSEPPFEWIEPAPTSAFRADLSRREGLLAAAAEVFGSHGYYSASLTEVARRGGVAAPSLYHYFDGKMELLVGILDRAARWIDCDATLVLRGESDPRRGLTTLLRGYVSLAAQHPEILEIFINDFVHLGPGAREPITATHDRYLDLWVTLLIASTGQASVEATTRVCASMSIVNEVLGTTRRRHDQSLAPRVASIAWSALGIDREQDSPVSSRA